MGYTFDRESGLSQLAHLYLVTNAHNKCVVQRALKEDPSLRQHLKQCGMNVAQARGDVRMMTEIYTMLMRTAPSSVNDSIRQCALPRPFHESSTCVATSACRQLKRDAWKLALRVPCNACSRRSSQG